MPVAAAMNEALAHYNAGRLQPAMRIAAQIVAARPQRADAHNLVGAILFRQGDLTGPCALSPRPPASRAATRLFFANLGEAERQRGNLDAALAALERGRSCSTPIPPRPSTISASSASSAGNSRRRRSATAPPSPRTPATRKPTTISAMRCARSSQRGGAREYQRALLLRENYPEAYNNLAAVLRDRGDKAEAEHCYRRAIEISPGYIEAYNNLVETAGASNRARTRPCGCSARR